ncbi:hypothetical protein G9A89_008263 [Geosiphon pyriformis]|nr:hypothetical protein G9A89_008263 [Geosiphon pyriformis]
MVAGGILLLVDILFVAAANTLFVATVDKWLVVDRLEFDILTVDILAVASLVDKSVDFNFVDISEFETGDRDFYIDFLIIGYLNGYGSQFVGVFVFHNSGTHVFFVATVDWLMRMDTTNSRNNWHFPDYCIIVEISIETSQISGDCFCVSLFDGGECVGQVIDTIVITKVSQEFCFKLIEGL